MYYAVYLPYGPNVVNREGNQTNILRRFATQRARRAFVEASTHHLKVTSRLACKVERNYAKAGLSDPWRVYARDYNEGLPFMD